MATVAATVSKPSLRALLGAPPARPHYRRSTTTKAPRKRTFVNLQMEKYNPGMRSEGTGSVLCKATAGGASELLQACTGGNDNSARGGNGGSSQPPRGNGGNGGDSSGQPQPVPRALVMGAATLLAALVLLPSQQAAASGPGLRTLRVAGASTPAAAPRSLCLNNTSSSNMDAAAATEGAILYGSVVLSEAERRLMARSSRQLFFSECVRVGAGGSSAVAART